MLHRVTAPGVSLDNGLFADAIDCASIEGNVPKPSQRRPVPEPVPPKSSEGPPPPPPKSRDHPWRIAKAPVLAPMLVESVPFPMHGSVARSLQAGYQAAKAASPAKAAGVSSLAPGASSTEAVDEIKEESGADPSAAAALGARPKSTNPVGDRGARGDRDQGDFMESWLFFIFVEVYFLNCVRALCESCGRENMMFFCSSIFFSKQVL